MITMAKRRFWNFIKNEASGDIPENIELRIEGEIIDDDEAWLYEWFGIPCASPNNFRNELKQYAGKDITVWIDSCGGSVFAAAGIYNALMEHKKTGAKVTTKVDGKAMSAATIPYMAGDERLMSPVAIFMMHNPLTSAQGYASDLRKAANVLDTVKETIVNAYKLGTGLSDSKISSLMDDETYMSAKTAVKEGFATGMLYTDNAGSNPSVVNFAFNRHEILNSANNTIKQLLEFQSKNKLEANTKNSDVEEEQIMDSKELKEKYPDIYNEIYNEGKKEGNTEGINNERERIKGIDEISAHADIKLVNKAKYEKPVDAKDLAMEIVKADGAKGQKYLDDLEQDSENSNVEDVEAAPDKPNDSPENVDKTKIKNAADKIASYFRKDVK